MPAIRSYEMECLALAGGFDSFSELKREQYFAVNSKGEASPGNFDALWQPLSG